MMRQPRQKDEKHLAYIRGLSCCICGDNTSTEAAHIRYACEEVGKRGTGLGERPDDKWSTPLCGAHHRQQHILGERVFWALHKLDPIKIAMELHGD